MTMAFLLWKLLSALFITLACFDATARAFSNIHLVSRPSTTKAITSSQSPSRPWIHRGSTESHIHLSVSNDASALEDDHEEEDTADNVSEDEATITSSARPSKSYSIGLGKNKPFSIAEAEGDNGDDEKQESIEMAYENWNVPTPVSKPKTNTTLMARQQQNKNDAERNNMVRWHAEGVATPKPRTTRRMIACDDDSNKLRGALWDEQHFERNNNVGQSFSYNNGEDNVDDDDDGLIRRPAAFYPDIDLSIPDSVYTDDGSVDLVWDLLKWEAQAECQREPLLVSFLYSTILNHKSLESSLAFLLANRLQSPAMMISTQLQSIILDTLQRDAQARRYLRADILAVRDRDPACNCLPDVFLYFKGFHALQSHRVAHNLWKRNKHVLAHYLQSQVSQVFQIDIHPNATMQSGIMLDHGTGIVIGATASVGHNCSILHHVTLGGSGVKGEKRHPTVADGVLLGAGATVLGNVTLGEGSQVGAGTLVKDDLPPHCVAVGVPGRIIGRIADVTEQPSVGMNQMIEGNAHMVTFESEGI